MDLLTIILLLMLGLLVSNIVSHYIPYIPTALTQIVFGVMIALIMGDYTFQIDAEWFLLLFLAPLLYNDGRHFSREELWGMKSQIFGNAFILVILTTVLCGFVIYWLVPSIPVAAALALAAILSPTDPVAVNGIAKRISVPEKVMALVRGESLINDASGLIAFKYAIAAAVTGYFSLREAVWDFSYHFLIGAIAGLLLGLIITFIRFGLRKNGINDPVFHSLLQILTPFGVFIVTEDLLHASGVIAVVVAGHVQAGVMKRHALHILDAVIADGVYQRVVGLPGMGHDHPVNIAIRRCIVERAVDDIERKPRGFRMHLHHQGDRNIRAQGPGLPLRQPGNKEEAKGV